MLRNLQLQMKLLENKLTSLNDNVGDFLNSNVNKEIADVQNNSELSSEQKDASLNLLVTLICYVYFE